MSTVTAIILADADRAFGAIRALEARHAGGCLAVFGLALLQRGADGALHLRRPVAAGSGGAPLARLVGLLVEGLRPGTADALDGFAEIGVDPDFSTECLGALVPGRFALLTELEEHWLFAVDDAVAEFEGAVVRRRRMHPMEDWLSREVAALDAELQALEREAEDVSGAAIAAIRRRVATARRRLALLAGRTTAGLEALQAETRLRIELLERQADGVGAAAKAGCDVRARIRQSITQLRGEAALRAARLHRTIDMARQALGSDAPEEGQG